MQPVKTNALLILRFMSENDYTGMKAVRVGDILADLRLAEEDFEQADTYLLQSGYLEGTIGGVAGSRWMQPAGLDFLEQEMEKRIPLSLTAEQILRLAIELEDKDPQTTVGGREMWEQLNITYDEYKKATLILGDEGLIESRISAEDTKFMTFAVTSSGRKALRRNFRKESTDIAARHLNIGAIFQGDVTDVNVLAVAQAYHSSIEQAITQSDTSSLRDEIEKILGELLKVVQPELSLEQYATYVSSAQQLRQEANKEKPDPSVLHKLLSVLNFAATIDGAVEFGEKALGLFIRLAPLMMPLYQAVLALLQ